MITLPKFSLMNTRPTRRDRFRKGFSLIEVTLALGISVLGITTVLGMLPQSLESIRKAGDLSADTHIVEQIMGEVTQAQWQDPTGADYLSYTYNGRRYYFDVGAQELKVRLPGLELAYVAQVTVEKTGATLPGGEADANLRRITVKVRNSPLKDVDFDQASPRSYYSYSALVSRTAR
ncbi:MAG: Verru Chthon cassette protein [Verrucomicrobiaceae bacterium]|nr:Verru Chthon cassette protein [Verrucomicrobiaceae bacterium]